MKITFVITGVYPVHTLKEIQGAYPEAFDQETFNYIKVIENNKEFEAEMDGN